MASGDSRAETPTVDLVKEAVQDARELVRAEIDLAKVDLREEAGRLKIAAFALGAAAGAAVFGGAMLLVALSLAIAVGPLPALFIGLGLVALAAIAMAVGYDQLPRRALRRTRDRLEADTRIFTGARS